MREDYQGADGHQGQSFTSYDASKKVWHQSWVTNRGESLTIEGSAMHQALLSQSDPPNPMYSHMEAGMAADETTLRQLNDQYVEAFMKADTEWYRAHLKDDFVCIESDGSVLNKRKFLVNAARGPDVTAYKLTRVDVRICDNVALVHAAGLFTGMDGSSGTSRHTDVYVRDGGSWKAVSAQITRVPAS